MRKIAALLLALLPAPALAGLVPIPPFPPAILVGEGIIGTCANGAQLINSSGVVSCGTAIAGGTINTSTSGNMAYYTGATAISGNASVQWSTSSLATTGQVIATSTGPASDSTDGMKILYTTGTGWLAAGAADAVAIGNGNLTAGGVPSTTLATFGASGNLNLATGNYQIGGTQISAANLSNGVTGSGAVVLAASPTVSGSLTLSGVTGSTQCLHVNTSGVVTGTGSDCGSGGGGGSLSTLSDVNVTEGAAIDNYQLQWNNSSSKWVAGANPWTVNVRNAPFNASGFIAQTTLNAALTTGNVTQTTTTITVSGSSGGTLGVGSVVTIPGYTSETITALVGGTGGDGTYTVSSSQTIGSATAFSATGVLASGNLTIPVVSTTNFNVGQIAVLEGAGTSGTKNFACFIASIVANTSITCSGTTAVSGSILPPSTTSSTSGTQATSTPPGSVVYTIGTTTVTTASLTSGSTSMTVASAASYAAGQGILIWGAGGSGNPYVGTITSVVGTTIGFTPATSTTVSAGAGVQHDDTAAFQATMNLVSPSTSISVFVPDGYYQINAQANAASGSLLQLPYLPYYDSGYTKWFAQATYRLFGTYPAPQEQLYLQSTAQPHVTGVILATTAAASTLGQPAGLNFLTSLGNSGSSRTISNIQLVIDNIAFRTYPNPNINVVNAQNTESLKMSGFDIDTGETGTSTQPTHAVWAVTIPGSSNGANNSLVNGEITGYYYGAAYGEHTTMSGVRFDALIYPIYYSTSIGGGNYGLFLENIYFDGCVHGIYVGSLPGTNGNDWIDARGLNIEHRTSPAWMTNSEDIYDSANKLRGHISFDNNPQNNVITGAANVTFENILQGGGGMRVGGNGLELGVQQTLQGALVLDNTAAGAYSTTLQASNSATASATYVLPTAQATAAGQVLTDAAGNGVLSWTTPPGSGSVGASSNNTFTGSNTFNGSTSLWAAAFTNAKELANINGSAIGSSMNFDFSLGSVYWSTANQTANWTVNFRFSSGTSFNSATSVGDTATAVVCALQGSTAYYNTAVTIDGNSVTPNWQGGTAPSVGNVSGYDCYTYVITKTAATPTYVVLASQTQF